MSVLCLREADSYSPFDIRRREPTIRALPDTPLDLLKQHIPPVISQCILVTAIEIVEKSFPLQADHKIFGLFIMEGKVLESTRVYGTRKFALDMMLFLRYG